MGSLFCLFKMGFTLNRKKTRDSVLHAPPTQVLSSTGATHDRSAEQRPSARPANKSRILRMLVYLRGFRESNRSSSRDEAATSPPETDLCNVSAESDDDTQHNNSSDSTEESTTLTNDTSNSSLHEDNHSDQLDTKQPPAEPIESTLASDACQLQSKFMPACLTGDGDPDLEVEDLIPPEYNAEKAENMFLGAKQTVETPSNGFEYNTDAAHTHPTQPVVLPLTETILFVLASYHNEADSMHNVTPRGPYRFTADPNHLAPDFAVQDSQGGGIHCPDGCVDCDVRASAVLKSKRLVYEWFEKRFTRDNIRLAISDDQHERIKYFREFTNVEYMDEDTGEPDWLCGATELWEFYWMKELYNAKEPEGRHPSELVVAHMKRADRISDGEYSYFHGFNYNVIVAEYEPRYLPNRAVSDDKKSSAQIRYQGIERDPVKPVWEARGRIAPGQTESARMMHARKEYHRQWVMYRKQDAARMRYVEEVLREAAAEHELAMR